MGSLKRKMARNKAKKAKKTMKNQLSMFDKLGDSCAACDKDFDKKSKQDVTTWSVVVREKEGIVRLYCTECWQGAKNFIKEVQDDLGIQKERSSEGSNTSES